MRFTKITLTLLLCIFATNQNAIAQTNNQITLEQAIGIALENNIQLQQAENLMGIQDANVRSAQADFLPNLNVGVNGNRSTGRQFNPEVAAIRETTQRGLSGQISSNVVIFDGLRNIYSLRAAQNNRLTAEENIQRQRENVIFNTATSFLTVILDEELLNVARENLETSLKQLELVKAQVEVGMRPMVELYNQEATVADNEFQVVQSESRLSVAKLQLTRVLGIDPLQDYEYVTPGIDDANLTMTNYSLPDLLEQAFANRSDVRSSELQINSAASNLRIARGAYLPTISLSASLSGNYSDQIQQINFYDQFTDLNRRTSVGFNVQIPIFNRYNVIRQVQISRIEYKNAVLDFESKKLEVYQEIRQAYNDYLISAKQLETTERALIAAEKAFETEQERFRIGSSTLIQLSQANSLFVTASSRRIQAVYQFVFQEKLLEYYLGRVSAEI
jgi:outer membrane protein